MGEEGVVVALARSMANGGPNVVAQATVEGSNPNSLELQLQQGIQIYIYKSVVPPTIQGRLKSYVGIPAAIFVINKNKLESSGFFFCFCCGKMQFLFDNFVCVTPYLLLERHTKQKAILSRYNVPDNKEFERCTFRSVVTNEMVDSTWKYVQINKFYSVDTIQKACSNRARAFTNAYVLYLKYNRHWDIKYTKRCCLPLFINVPVVLKQYP